MWEVIILTKTIEDVLVVSMELLVQRGVITEEDVKEIRENGYERASELMKRRVEEYEKRQLR